MDWRTSYELHSGHEGRQTHPLPEIYITTLLDVLIDILRGTVLLWLGALEQKPFGFPIIKIMFFILWLARVLNGLRLTNDGVTNGENESREPTAPRYTLIIERLPNTGAAAEASLVHSTLHAQEEEEENNSEIPLVRLHPSFHLLIPTYSRPLSVKPSFAISPMKQCDYGLLPRVAPTLSTSRGGGANPSLVPN